MKAGGRRTATPSRRGEKGASTQEQAPGLGIDYSQIDYAKLAEELRAGLPELERRLRELDEAGRVDPRVLDIVFTW